MERAAGLRRACERQSSELQVRMDRLLIAHRRRVETAALQLQERSPFQLLERGYAIAYDTSGRVLRSPDQVELGSDVSVRLSRGRLEATVHNKAKFEQEGS